MGPNFAEDRLYSNQDIAQNMGVNEHPLHFESSEMRSIVGILPRLARSQANILIFGESGTGKELIANLLHQLSFRSEKNFIAVNCAAIPETLLESELFGHERGSFTGAVNRHAGLLKEAEGGTLFLDEIGDMPLALQSKLLRVLQDKVVRSVGGTEDKTIDFRLIAATNRNLKRAVKEGLFRADLYYRLSVVPLEIPPLRDRPDDIPGLIQTFLESFAKEHQVPVPRLSHEALENLVRRRWQGNVRELKNLIERVVVLNGHKPEISAGDLPSDRENCRLDQDNFKPSERMSTMDELAEQYILYVLQKVGQHQGRASEILGINRRTLYRKLKAYSNESQNLSEYSSLIEHLMH